MKKILLSATLSLILIFSLHAQKKVMTYGFEPSGESTDVYFDTIDHQPGDVYELSRVDESQAHGGSAYLYMESTSRVNNWLRAVKMRNLTFEEKTSYRFSFWIKADSLADNNGNMELCQINAAPMQGVDYSDSPILAYNAANANGVSNFGGWQSNFSPDKWIKRTVMFYYESEEQMQTYWDANKPSWSAATLPVNYFFLFNFFTVGNFMIDDLEMWESSIGGVQFNGNTIHINFGYAIDMAKAGLSAANPTMDFPTDAFFVDVNGGILSVSSATLHNDGKIVLVLDEQLKPEDEVLIDFYNPVGGATELYYGSPLHPASFEANDTWKVQSFYAEVGEHNPEIVPVQTNVANFKAMNYHAYTHEGMLYVQSSSDKILDVQLMNIAGTSLKSQKMTGSTSMNVSDLPKGMYLLTIRDQQNKVAVQKINLK
ncbi:MAG: T9SS type A sorting domain-containing protein [Prolixibacteraceae bacterium]|nr:T9SS type A sorting domain-containing protein [Prolixibacteraceae bacterium]